MKTILGLIGAVLLVCGLMLLQLRSMKKYHPNTELLLDTWQRIETDAAEK